VLNLSGIGVLVVLRSAHVTDGPTSYDSDVHVVVWTRAPAFQLTLPADVVVWRTTPAFQLTLPAKYLPSVLHQVGLCCQ
jgi:hypothetical protein